MIRLVVLGSEVDFDRLIGRDRRIIRIYFGYVAFVVLLGAALVAGSFVTPSTSGSSDLLLRLGGGFIATLGAVPLREVISRYERIGWVRSFRDYYATLLSAPERDENLLARAREVAWKLVEKGVVGPS